MLEGIGVGLGKELVGMAVLLLIGKAFGWLKKRARQRKSDRYEAAVASVEIAVHECWLNFVKYWKSGGKKLTDEQKRQLRVELLRRAREVGEKHGVDPLKVITGEAIDLLVKKIVDARRRGGLKSVGEGKPEAGEASAAASGDVLPSGISVQPAGSQPGS